MKTPGNSLDHRKERNIFVWAMPLGALAVLLFLFRMDTAAVNKTLWHVGKTDGKNTEYALAPNRFSDFRQPGLFVVGSSDPTTDWPYVHPGPADTWAGSQPHLFSIIFALPKKGERGTCRLILDLLDTQSQHAPTLQVSINGKVYERVLPRGAGDASINGEPGKGAPHQVVFEFPARLLRRGHNTIDIINAAGSWILYDAIVLEAPEKMETAAVADYTALHSVNVSPGAVQSKGERSQRISGSVIHLGAPQSSVIKLNGKEVQTAALKTGRNEFQALVPAVDHLQKATLSLSISGRGVSSQEITLIPGVQEIVVAFKTHFDIGYTEMASNVVQRYQTTMIEQALEVADRNRDLPKSQQFAWTIAGWPMHKILADWPGQTAERKQRVQNALTAGRFAVHALPFSTHTELLEVEDLVRGLGFSTRLSREFGIELPRDGKMTDVPEHTWMLPTLLKHAGVEFMHIGCNSASAALRVPTLFWWEGPDRSRVLTMYSPDYGTHLMPPKNWPHKTWLALLHTGDNHGPPRPGEVKHIIDQVNRELPGVKVRIGRMSDFGDAILAEKPELPVIRGDAPDTWIHGPMSDPAGARIARNVRPLIGVTEALRTQLHGWGVGIPDITPQISRAYENSLLYGEHTWGGAIYWIGNRLSFGDQFKTERAANRFQQIEASWAEHTSYIETTRDLVLPALDQNMQTLAQNVGVSGKRIVVYNPSPWKRDGVVSVRWDGTAAKSLKVAGQDKVVPVENNGKELRFLARDVPPMGYQAYSPIEQAAPAAGLVAIDQKTSTIQNAYFKATFDRTRGVVQSLVDKRSGRELIDSTAAHGFGQFLHERFDNDQVSGFARSYLRFTHPDFVKPGLPSAKEQGYQSASPQQFALRFEETALAVTAVMQSGASTNLPAVTTRFTLHRDQPYIDMDITIHDKPFEPWPEAGWLCLPLKVSNPQFRLGRLAAIVDPTRDVIPGGNRHLFGLNTGVAVVDQNGRGVALCPIDHPLISLDQPGCWKYSLDFLPRKPAVYLNLFNNQWSTNFRLWNQGTWTSRVRLWPVDRFDPDPSLITPSLEARLPLQAAVAVGPAGSLPVTRAGLAISRKGVLVSTFATNPDGPGTVLRLWEYAGNSGKCDVRLPDGYETATVQPIDLRGRAVGRPIPVKANSFSVELRPFAPLSFQLGGAAGRTVEAARAGGVSVPGL